MTTATALSNGIIKPSRLEVIEFVWNNLVAEKDQRREHVEKELRSLHRKREILLSTLNPAAMQIVEKCNMVDRDFDKLPKLDWLTVERSYSYIGETYTLKIGNQSKSTKVAFAAILMKARLTRTPGLGEVVKLLETMHEELATIEKDVERLDGERTAICAFRQHDHTFGTIRELGRRLPESALVHIEALRDMMQAVSRIRS